MEILKLNETPKRTSRNFNINNIKLENVEIPNNIGKFENLALIYEKKNIIVSEDVEISKLTYGLGEVLEDKVLKNSNVTKKLKINGKIKEDIILEFKLDKNNTNLIENIEIIAEENSQARIIIKYESEEEILGFHNGIIRVNAKDNSIIEIILVNLINKKINNFISIENTLSANSKVDYKIVDFGGKNSITNYYSNILGENASNTINTIYLGTDEQVIDINYIVELRGKKSKVDIKAEGALKDIAKKHFKGTIDFKKGCKKATGNETENCMLLSDTAKSIALPMLLCSEEEVEGNHSSSAGKVGEKELFYIMSRGFSQKEAMKLMVRAKFNNLLEKIYNEKIKEQILTKIDDAFNTNF